MCFEVRARYACLMGAHPLGLLHADVRIFFDLKPFKRGTLQLLSIT